MPVVEGSSLGFSDLTTPRRIVLQCGKAFPYPSTDWLSCHLTVSPSFVTHQRLPVLSRHLQSLTVSPKRGIRMRPAWLDGYNEQVKVNHVELLYH